MKKILLLLMMGIFLISLASGAISNLGTFKVNAPVELIQTCSNCTFNNITVLFFPDGTQTIFNSLMTKNQTHYNFTLSSTFTQQMGEYFVNGIGDPSGINDNWNYKLTITADGKKFQQFPQQFAVIFLAFLLVAFGLVKERLRLFKHVGGILMMIMGVLTLFPGYSFINWTTLLGKTLAFSLIGLGFYFLIEDSFSRDDQEERFSQGGGFNND